ncbi:DUF2164 domain-containing protein [Aquibacillus sediminis]|uniref:DUF2164 domain-containing protein n=1 Tax=Aquibacillus sediminis TaxID=2574734 RepID=UPI001108F8D5|nr:DUF2164 domain-containing protein [Aquibacillus sediminis]
MNQQFNLRKEDREYMTNEIKQYFEQEKNEQIGDLAATLMLDFFIDKLAPTFYNLGVEDAHAYLNEKLDDLFEIQKR